ncbi:hypothetical protein MNBD_GAMMA09-23 [hydrothermal vent metagenome]|uniref:NlpC/P60 domain-containing protein n=1 Tax=hydrothermal vent metagenome TaxID=652676 RepID=A0A3B0X513_9ZZZZ
MLAKVVLLVVIFSIPVGCAGHKIPPSVHVSKSGSTAQKKLYAQYNDWRGVKYRIGGNSKKGIDCSGFVHLTYKQQFNKNVPRTTQLLARKGKQVKRKNIRPGDAVFFKTGLSIRHVGIYVGEGKFLHASTSRGVMISELKNPYWQKSYWMSRRY